VPSRFVRAMLGGRGIRPVARASLLGVPLPLCSCSVVPMAVSLRREGASRGATVAFLISTPETGIDSIAISAAMLDPLLTVFRPLAAFSTGVLAGTIEDSLGEKEPPPREAVDLCKICPPEMAEVAAAGHSHTVRERAARALRYAFRDLFNDLAGWLLLGVLVAGALGAFLEPEFVRKTLPGEWGQMLAMLVLSLPLYICATASTPIAAGLLAGGFTPGAAFVLLLAGPATNVATIAMVAREMGIRTTAVYLGTIAGAALALGWLLNRLYEWLALDVTAGLGALRAELPWWARAAGVGIFALLFLDGLRRRLSPSPRHAHKR